MPGSRRPPGGDGKGRRAGGEPLGREEILATALAIARHQGLEATSARRLATELGVTPMALYRHVADMEEVVLEVVDVLWEEEGLPDVGRRDWRGWLEGMARSLRRLFAAQPAALELFSHRPVTSPWARRRLTTSVEVLVRSGFSPQGAAQAYAAVHTYTIGFCALATARQRHGARGHHPLPAQGPRARQQAAAIERFVSDRQFDHGLRALLAGLGASRAAARRPRR